MKIIDRYIIKEMLFPFLYGVAAFTVLFMSVSSNELISNIVSVSSKGGWQLLSKYILSMLPQVLVYTFPMGVLLATLMAFGRLSGDSEIIAMKAGGVSFIRIGIPALFLTVIISIVSAYMMEYIVPEANYTATNIILKQALKDAQEDKENLVFSSYEPGGYERRIFAKSLNEALGELTGVMMFYFKQEHRAREVYAPKAVWKNNLWYLVQPRIYEFNENQEVKFESQSVSAILPIKESPMEISKREKKPAEMPRKELVAKIALMKDMANTAAVSLDKPSEASYRKLYRKMRLILYQRHAIPVTCFVFGLFGIPLALRPQRTSTSIGLGLSLVFILFYYMLMTAGRAFALSGSISPLTGAWLPNIVFGIIGVVLFINARRS